MFASFLVIVSKHCACISDCGTTLTENQDPPPRKRLRRSSEERVTRSSDREGTLRDKHQTKSTDEVTTYSAELLLYDRQRRCPLSAGRYDVAVEEPKPSSSSTPLGKHSTWETVTDGKVCGAVILIHVHSCVFCVGGMGRYEVTDSK